MARKHMLSLLTALSMVLVTCSGLGGAAATASDGPVLTQGESPLIPGGAATTIAFPDGSVYGLQYGTAAEPGPITLFSYQRNLEGIGAVSRSLQDRPVVVHRVFMQTFATLLEYDDLNGDGLLDVERTSLGFGAHEVFIHEPILKGTSLSTAWEASTPITTTTEDGPAWEVTLTANDLGYRAVGFQAPPPADPGVLEHLAFTFHLSTEQVSVIEQVPILQVDVDASGAPIGYAQGGGSETIEVVRNDYRIKYDTSISGWDLTPGTVAPRLFMESRTFAGKTMPFATPTSGRDADDRYLVVDDPHRPGLVDADHMRYRERIRAMGGMLPPPDMATHEDDEMREHLLRSVDLPEEGRLYRSQALAGDRFSIEDAWAELAALSWVDNATVDGVDGQVEVQLLSARPASQALPRDTLAVGQEALLGISYPGGEDVFHDPTFEGSALAGLASSAADGHGLPRLVLVAGLLVVGGVFMVMAAAGVGAAWSRKRIAAELDETTADPDAEAPDDGDWEVFLD